MECLKSSATLLKRQKFRLFLVYKISVLTPSLPHFLTQPIPTLLKIILFFDIFNFHQQKNDAKATLSSIFYLQAY